MASQYRDLATRGQLLALMIVAGLLWVFIWLADQVSGGDTHQFDRNLLLLLRNPADPSDPLGPRWLEDFGRDVSALGAVGIVSVLVLTVAGFLWLRGAHRSSAFLLTSVTTGSLLSPLLKAGFDRPRPDLVPHGSFVYNASFPSGHSLMAAIVYLTLGVLIARTIENRVLQAYVMSLAMLVMVSVGCSRVYLGVHWPTDVLAGWIVGAAWVLLCTTVASWLARRGSIERGS